MKPNFHSSCCRLHSAFAFLAALITTLHLQFALGRPLDASPLGSCLSFDGVDDHVLVNGVSLANSSFTIEAWVNREATGNNDFFLGQGTGTDNQGLHFGFRANNKFTLGFWGNDLDTPPDLDVKNWHHWAGTYEATTKLRCIYRDGVLVASATVTTTYIGSGSIQFGGIPQGTQFSFQGLLDDVRIWNVSRTPGQIQAQMLQPLAGTETGLLAYYRLDENTGTTASNSATTGAALNGTLYGPIWNDFNIFDLKAFTMPATVWSSTAAILKGYVDPKGVTTTAWFEWGVTTNFGTRTLATNLISGTNPVQLTCDLTGLSSAITYRYRMVATDSTGTNFGADVAFTPSANLITWPVASLSSSSVNLYGSVNPKGLTTTAWFEWGTTTGYGSVTAISNIGSGTADVLVSTPLSGLSPGLTYHYRVAASNRLGMAYGPDQSFVSEWPPQPRDALLGWSDGESMSWGASVGWTFGWFFQANHNISVTALGVYDLNAGWQHSHQVGLWSQSGTLLATATVTSADPLISQVRWVSLNSPVQLDAGGTYLIGAYYPGSATDSFRYRATSVSMAPAVTYLRSANSADTTFSFPRGENAYNDGYFGPNFRFLYTEELLPPTNVMTAITLPVTGLSSTSASLNGSVNPGGLATTAWFQWGTSISYGSSTTATNLGSGSSAVSLSASLTGLSPDITYHCRIVARTSTGTNYGADVAFTTQLTNAALFGSCLAFDGVDDYVLVTGQVPLANSSFTIEAWVKRDTIDNDDFFLGQGTATQDQGLHFGFRGRNSFTFAFWTDDLDTPADLDTQKWHHWCGTYDATTKLRCIYRDGILIASATATANYQGSGSLRIGGIPQGSNFSFKGLLDEIRLWNVVRTPAQIRTYLFRPLAGTETGLLAYYRFDESSGTIAQNSSSAGAALNGTLYGPTRSSPSAVLANVVTLPAIVSPSSAATLNGYANPNGRATTAWFEWGSTTAYGMTTEATDLGVDIYTVPLSFDLTGLSPGNTYHYRVVATNASGNVAGGDQTFTILPDFAPVSVSGFNADLVANGTGVTAATSTSTYFTDARSAFVFYAQGFVSSLRGPGPKGLPATGAFASSQYPTIDYQLAPYSGNNALLLRSASETSGGGATSGTLVLATPGKFAWLAILASCSDVGSIVYSLHFQDGSSTSGSLSVPYWYDFGGGAISGFGRISRGGTGVTADTFEDDGSDDPTLYDFIIELGASDRTKLLDSIIFTYASGGRTAIFGLSGQAGVLGLFAETLPATAVSASAATLNGSVNPNGLATTACFQWGTSASYGNTTTVTNLGSGTSAVALSFNLTGLSPATTYHYRVAARTSTSTNYGADVAFTTQPATAPPFGYSLSFDGVDDYLAIGGSSINPPWTAEFWVNRLDTPDVSAALLSDGTYALKLEQWLTSRRVGISRFGVTDSSFNYSAPAGTWVHLAFVADSNTRLYVDGFLQDTLSQTIPLPLGHVGGRTGDRLKGLVDEVRLWNVVRTEAQIQANMNAPLAGTESGLVAYWPFNEGNGLTTADASGHGLTATLMNGTAWYPFSTNAVVTTLAATGLSSTTATLNGSINPAGLATTAWFEWGTTTSYGSTTTTTNLGSGTSPISASFSLTGLSSATTYHYRVVARNSTSTNYGADISFTTATTTNVLTVTTLPATVWSSNTVTLNGSVSPAGLQTTAWFEWGTTTSYGSTTTTTNLGSGTNAVQFNFNLTGLLPGSTYHYRVRARNSNSTNSGADVAFTMSAGACDLFQFPINYATGSNAICIAVGDFNGDSHPDLAVAHLDSVSVLLGNGEGTFQTAANYYFGYGPTLSVAAGDFNGDGHLDLTVASGELYVLLGNGDGTFQSARYYHPGGFPESVAVGDFNGDGHLDLVAANHDTGKVGVLLGNGDGTFQSVVSYAAGSSPDYVVVGDFNSDSRLDLAVVSGGIYVLLGNGDGTFQSASAVGGSGSSLAIGDFNGDSHLDLAVASSSVSVLLGNGDGSFQAASAVGGQSYSVAVGDFNGDGYQDLAVGSVTRNIQVLLGSGHGSFQAGSRYDAASPCIYVAEGDFNGDGKPDLVGAHYSDIHGISVLLGNTCATPNMAPVTLPATSLSSTAATLNGSVNPGGLASTAWFEWGITTNYGSTTRTTNLGSGITAVPISFKLAGLSPASTYHYRVVARNAASTNFGADVTFTTITNVLTLPPTVWSSTAVTVNGSVNPEGLQTIAWFEWGPATNYGNSTIGTNLNSGTSGVLFGFKLTGLLPGTTYHCRAMAMNSSNTYFGADVAFTMTPCPGTPVVTLVPNFWQNHPPIPAGLKLSTVKECSTTMVASEFPVLVWNGIYYWPCSYSDNRSGMCIIAYDSLGNFVGRWDRMGDRYIRQITINPTLRTVTLSGQSCGSIVLTWDELCNLSLPAIYCPPNVSRSTDLGQCSATVNPGTPTVSFATNVTGVRSDGQALNAPYPKGVTTITWTATDQITNMVSCTQTITVNDTEPPVITCPAPIVWATDAGKCYATTTVTPARATDNCGATVTGTRSDGQALDASYPKGVTMITWTARDSASNSASCTQTVSVNDTEPPVISSPAAIAQCTDPGKSCATVAVTPATAIDNCGVTVTGVRSDGLALNATYPKGVTTITWTAMDGSSNSASCTQSITVNDTEPPQIQSSTNLVACTDAGQCTKSNVTWVVSATDNCTVTNLECTPPSGSSFALGTQTVVCSATDDSGNTCSCSFTVTVQDTEPPTINCPADLTVEFETEAGAVVSFAVEAVDVCDSLPLVECVPPSGSTFPIGTTPVHCSATDASSNSSPCTFSITVLGARGVKQNVLAEIRHLCKTVTRNDDAVRLDDALKHLTDSLVAELWVDQTHLERKYGEHAFIEEHYIVEKLCELAKDPKNTVSADLLAGFINRITAADRLLAAVAIQEATSAGAAKKKLESAARDLAKGDSDISNPKCGDGIENYKNAWKLATHAKLAESVTLRDGRLQIEILGTTGETYLIQSSTNLVDWVTLGTRSADAEGVILFEDPAPGQIPARFYRVVSP